ncbi:hypothetical protein Vafri_4641 [Volvox africanus]|uniref:Uncharacterized protein n=1 Tax=Volvox africanus TaxID=51714 RepID=A0A8J4AV95_9CHLO|nr:hypothetical protein Vafri_4641 [Volvox africanus]
MSSDNISATKKMPDSHDLDLLGPSIIEENRENFTVVKEDVKEATEIVKQSLHPNEEEGDGAADQGKTLVEYAPLVEKEDTGDLAASADQAQETAVAVVPSEAAPSGHATIAEKLRETVIEKPAKFLSEKGSVFNEKLIAGFDYVGSHLGDMTRCLAAPPPDGDDEAGSKADDGHHHHHTSGPVAFAEKV